MDTLTSSVEGNTEPNSNRTLIGKGVTTNPDECKGVHSSEWKRSAYLCMKI